MFKINSFGSLQQGFNFNRNKQNRIMHVKSLTIGAVQLNPDFQVIDPTTGQTASVVGIGSYIGWQQAPTAPIFIKFNLSRANASDLVNYVSNRMDNTRVSFEVETYEYDPNARAYFKAFWCDAKQIKGNILCDGRGKLAGFVDHKASTVVQSPASFPLSFGFTPEDEQQLLITQVNETAKNCHAWGVERA